MAKKLLLTKDEVDLIENRRKGKETDILDNGKAKDSAIADNNNISNSITETNERIKSQKIEFPQSKDTQSNDNRSNKKPKEEVDKNMDKKDLAPELDKKAEKEYQCPCGYEFDEPFAICPKCGRALSYGE